MPRRLPRTSLRARLRRALRDNSAVLLLGPRQCSKTTLARDLVELDSPTTSTSRPQDRRRATHQVEWSLWT